MYISEKPRYTAARECYEETFGILGSASSLAAALKDFVTNNAFKVHRKLVKHPMCTCIQCMEPLLKDTSLTLLY